MMENLKTLLQSYFYLQSRHVKESDARSESLIFMLILSSIFSPMILSVGIGFCLYFFLESISISVVFGLFAFFMASLNYRSLLHNISNGTIAFTLILSIVVSALLMIPFKLSMGYEEYVESYEIANKNKLATAESKIYKEVKILHQEEKDLRNKLQKAADSYSSNPQSLADARRNLQAFSKEFENRKKEIRANAIANSGYQENLEISKMELLRFFVLQSFSLNGSGENFIFWIQFFLIFLIEGSPGLIALGLKNSSFSTAVEYDIKTKAILVKRRSMLEREMATDESMIAANQAKIILINDMLSTFGTNKFDSKAFLESLDKKSFDKTPKESSIDESKDNFKQNGSPKKDDAPKFKY